MRLVQKQGSSANEIEARSPSLQATFIFLRYMQKKHLHRQRAMGSAKQSYQLFLFKDPRAIYGNRARHTGKKRAPNQIDNSYHLRPAF